jgi:hypothetical protein
MIAPKTPAKPAAAGPKINKYLITAAQRGAVVAQPQLAGLENYAKLIGAQIFILPLDGLNDSDMLDPVLTKHTVINGNYELTRILYIRHFNVRPQAVNPLGGNIARQVAATKSAIIASPKQFLKPCANGLSALSKTLVSTGAITEPHYRDNQTGNVASGDHVIGALYVETQGELYNLRFIQITDTGAIYDLGNRIKPKSKKLTPSTIDTLVLGDWHTRSICPLVRTATRRMIQTLKPKHLIVHDLFDGTSVNHHESLLAVTRALRSAASELNLKDELFDCGTELEFLQNSGSPTMQIHVVKSNHDEFLDRYLEAGLHVKDPQNYVIGSALVVAMSKKLDPLEEGIYMATGKRLPRVHFLHRDQDFYRYNWQLGAHGDLGANGSKASMAQLEVAYSKSITGHKHTPEIMRNTIVVGTSTRLDPRYVKGLSSWMNAHVLIQPNGKAQMILIVDGRYEF